MRLTELLAGVAGVRVRGDTDLEVGGLCYDSRRVRPGDLFLTWTGFRQDGHAFCGEAVARGAVACMVERPGVVPAGVTEIVVADCRVAMAEAATVFFGRPTERLSLIGVTGTKGKTTTTYLVRQVLSRVASVGLLGTVQSIAGGQARAMERTTPESVDLQAAFREMVDAGDRFCVMEVSSHALELHRVDGCRFDVGVFTNLGRDHLDFHPTVEAYAAAKAKLFARLGKAAVANGDDPMMEAVTGGAAAPRLTYGLGPGADVRAADLELLPSGARFTAIHQGVRSPVRLRLPGRFNVYNALAALTVGVVYGLELPEAAAALGELAGVPGRFEVVSGRQPFTVVVDYAHTPDSLEQVLAAARELTAGRVIAVFGAGGDRDRGKRPLMGEAAASRADLVFLTSDNPRSEEPEAILAEIEQGVRRVPGAVYRVLVDRAAAIREALGEAAAGDVVVIAGKGHETYQIFADRTVHFDDREIAGQVLRDMGY